ncbi:tetratricopeptide repeat protein [Aureispira anguillae]|uniref:Tetratricopeptide repeat protein n=2 Tax=Aureispira anguillae TaxID=2864201 RepID=A0A916DW54_9BACT|nr:tetratricopeptide repeat protein [Aureispira anguillae]
MGKQAVNAQVSTKELIEYSKKYIYTDLDSATWFIQEALRQAEKEKDSLLWAKSLKIGGVIYYSKGELENASALFYKANYFFKRLNKAKDLAQIQNNQALIYRDLGLYDRAAKLHLSTLEFFESVKDTLRIGQVYNNLGIVYQRIKDLDLALTYYNKALMFNKYMDAGTLGALFLNKGIIYDLKDQNKQALVYYLKALDYYQSVNYVEDVIGIYINIAALHIKATRLDSALYYHQKADQEGASFVQYNPLYYGQLGEIYYKKKEYKKALEHLNKAYLLKKENGVKFNLRIILRWLRETYMELGQYEDALKYTIEEKELQDSLYQMERIKLVQSLEIQYNVEKKEQQIVSLNDSLVLAKNQKLLADKELVIQKIHRNVSILGIGILLIFIGLIINRMRIRKKLFLVREASLEQQHRISELERKQLQADLEHKSRTLSNLALSAIQKNEMLDTLDEKLQMLVQKDQQASLAIKPIQKMLKEQVSIEEDWNQFKVHFEEVHPEFYKKLLAISTTLTQNDLRHCTYIKVKLESKEIARIMGISPKSVQMSRYRIKKKLQLDRKEDLFVFIERL